MTQTNSVNEDMSSGKWIPKHVSLSDMRENTRDNAMKFVDTVDIMGLFRDIDNTIALHEKNIDKFLFKQEVLPHVRETSPEEYAKWLSKRIKAWLMPTHFYDYEFFRQKFYTLWKNRKIYINGKFCWSHSFKILVPEWSSVQFRDIGHCNIYDMNDTTRETRIVPIFKDIIELLDPEAKELALKWEKNQRETTSDFRDIEKIHQDSKMTFNKEILPHVRETNPLEYANWLSEAIQRGFIPTSISKNMKFDRSYTLNKNTNLNISDKWYFCWALSFNILVPEGSSIKFNNHNHCSIYNMNTLTSKEIKKIRNRPISPEIAKYLSDSAKKILKGVYDRKLRELLERQPIIQNELNQLKSELKDNKENIVTYGHLLSSEEKAPIIITIKKIEREIYSLDSEHIDEKIEEMQMILKELS